jgi:peptide methionine sulfoxide reductase MsrB
MGLPGVEIDQVGAIQERLLGAELRCKTCGGHLGDVFNDGYLFVGTPAFVTGKRFCIDGAALVFHPKDGTPDLRGDTPAPMPDWMRSPEIKPSSLKA